MPDRSIQGRAHDLMVALLQSAATQWGEAEAGYNACEVWRSLPEGNFSQPGAVLVVERPRVTGREFTSNDRVNIPVSIRMLALAPSKPTEEGRLDAVDRAELLRDRAIRDIETQAGCGLLELGAFSHQQEWDFGESGEVGSNMVAVEFTLRVFLNRYRDAVVAPSWSGGAPVFPSPVSGWSGAPGASGFSGFSGAAGASGFSGYSGFSGTNGTNGTIGVDGVSGFSGFSGSQYAPGLVADASGLRVLSAGDDTKIIVMSASGARVTVPASLAAGFQTTIIQDGLGKLAWSGASGMAVRSYVGAMTHAGQYSAATLTVVASGESRLNGQLG